MPFPLGRGPALRAVARPLIVVIACAAWCVIPSGQEATVRLADGTHIVLRLLQFISSETSVPGDTVRFSIQDDVVINGAVAIKRGTPTTASIIDATRMRWRPEWWSWPPQLKNGRLALALNTARAVDGQPIRLRASPLFPAAGLAIEMEPRSIMKWAHEGERFNAFVDGNYQVRPTSP